LSVFADTSGIYALLDRDDANHMAASGAWTRLLEDDSNLVTTNYVLIEVSALLQRRLSLAALRAFHADFVPLLRVEWIVDRQHTAAVEAVLTASRKKLSIVDCVSFQTMREQGIHTAFCFDKHFVEQGFDTIP
jgi:predicted nucleic acid-binding protein